MAKVESFTLDHNKVKAPYVRLAGSEENQGARIQKFDLRLVQPNQDAMPTGVVHTLEHFLAIHLRDELEGVIDCSPMGCRTGFYLIMWGEHDTSSIARGLEAVLKTVINADRVEATTAKECGNFRDHSLYGAKEYAKEVLQKGISSDPFQRIVE